MGWEHGAYMTFGVLTMVCLGLTAWPARVGAALLFWPFAAGACLYAWLLIKDLVVLARGEAPSVLVDVDDSVVFLVVELTLLAVATLLFIMWRPFRGRNNSPVLPDSTWKGPEGAG
jgi:hypothetical protein